jgi:putative hydrolase of the HAD superfamily
VAKPDAAIFLEACRRAGSSPRESLYVGDRLETDAIASRQAGLHGVWLDRTGGLESQTGDIPIITSLSELPDHVREFQNAQFFEPFCNVTVL